MRLFLLLPVLLTGCIAAVPVKQKFPEAPKMLMNTCPQLNKLKDDPTLSDVSKTVSGNYQTYYECAVRVDGWIEWYQIQKNIFEEANK